MNVIIINAAPGVGKTTLLREIVPSLSKCAVLDGDDVGRIVPLEHSLEWLNLIQDNMIACAKNFEIYGIKTLFISFVFPSIERIKRLIEKLKDDGHYVYHITLTCEDQVLENRLKQRNSQKLISIIDALHYNQEIKLLQADYTIDTTRKNKNEVKYLLIDKIKNVYSK